MYAVMYWQIFARLGEPVQVWLKSARIQYRKPAHSALTLEFDLDEQQIEDARSALRRDGRFEPVHRTEAIDRSGDVCAFIDTQVHLRQRRPDQKQISEF